MQRCRHDGAMASLEASLAEVEEVQRNRSHQVSIAGINGPRQTVISGDEDVVDQIVRTFSERGRRTRRLNVSHAFHSHHMDGMLEEFAEVARSCTFAPPKIELSSGVAHESQHDPTTPEYWVQQVRRPVRFHQALLAAHEQGARRFLECGPSGVLSAMGSACITDDTVFVPSLRKKTDDVDALASAIGMLHVAGEPIAWSPLLGDGRGVDTPTYPFQRQSYWQAAPDKGLDAEQLGLRLVPHPWLGGIVRLADSEQVALTGRVSLESHGWLDDHTVFESTLMPGTGLLDMALAAGRAVGASTLETLVSLEPIRLQPGEPVRLQLRIEGLDEQGRREFSLHGQSHAADDEAALDLPWTCHARGQLSDAELEPDPGFASLEHWPVPGCSSVDLSDFYARIEQMGLSYGPAFRGLVELWRGPDRGERRVAFARIRIPESVRGRDGFALHPALLDAALHAAIGVAEEVARPGEVLIPYRWSGATLMATGSTELRVRATLERRTDGAVVSLCLADSEGRPVARVDHLELRAVRADALRGAGRAVVRHQYRLGLQGIECESGTDRSQVVVSVGGAQVSAALGPNRVSAAPSIDAIVNQALAGADIPAQIILDGTALPASSDDDDDVPQQVEAITKRVLAELQSFVASSSLAETSLVLVTRDAVSFGPDDGATAFPLAGVWGLVRAVRNEHAERQIRLIDLDPRPVDPTLLQNILAIDHEPEIAVRAETASVVRLELADAGPERPFDRIDVPTGGDPWRLTVHERGRLDTVGLIREPQIPVAPGEVRVEVRASGMNFRDVLHALGMVDSPKLGLECAGRVTEVGADVEHLRVGSRVMGMAIGSFGSEIVMDARYMVEIPERLDYVSAATIPLVFLTALYAFEDLGKLHSGERVLIHAATGGVGMAALQLARHRGAEVFGTASPAKWPVLRALGLDDDHIASSRDPGFAESFSAGAQNIDVVLNSLTGEFVSSSLSMMTPGGRFLEMGKTDIREPGDVAAAHPGVTYQAFDLIEAGPERIQQMLQRLAGLLAEGAIEPLPVMAYELRQIRSALRFMAQARHVGKIVLTLPGRLDPEGTVWITGGTGELGQQVARHLVSTHGVRDVILSSRRGPDAPGADALVTTLEQLGARSVRIVACDVARQSEVERVLANLPPEGFLTGILHLAGVVDDGLVGTQTPKRLARVLAPKVRGAWNLHHATKGMDLDAFVLFSSIAGSTGGPGQSNYAAANAFLDGLAAWRHKRGLPATSLAWGLWEPSGEGMTSHLGRADLLRMRRQGIGALSTREGLRLLDDALVRPDTQLLPAKLELSAMARAKESGGAVPPLMQGLIRPSLREVSEPQGVSATGLVDELSALPATERNERLMRAVQAEVAAVLGLSDVSVVRPTRTLQELGLDSLMAVELNNRLGVLIQSKLSATVAFDYPTPKALTDMLMERLALDEGSNADAAPSPPQGSAEALRWAMQRLSPGLLESSGLLERLVDLAQHPVATAVDPKLVHIAAELTAEQMDAELDAVLGSTTTDL